MSKAISLRENKALSRRFFEEFISEGNLAVADEVLGPDIDHVAHGAPPGTPPGPKGAKQTLTIYRTAFPDLYATVEFQLTEGDRVVTFFTLRGTHKGEFQGIAPTNRPVKISGITIDRIVGGKIVERWAVFDRLGILQQIGVVPKPGQK